MTRETFFSGLAPALVATVVLLSGCQPKENIAELGKTDPQYSVLFRQMEGMEALTSSWGLEKTFGNWAVAKSPGLGSLIRAWNPKTLAPYNWDLAGSPQPSYMNADPATAANELKKLSDQGFLVYSENRFLQAPWVTDPRVLPRKLVSELLLTRADWYYHQRLYPLVSRFRQPELRAELLWHLTDLAVEAYATAVLGKDSSEYLGYRSDQAALQTIANLAASAVAAYQDLAAAEPDVKLHPALWLKRAQIFQKDFEVNYDSRFRTPLYHVYAETPPTLAQALAWSSQPPQARRPSTWTAANLADVILSLQALPSEASLNQVFPAAAPQAVQP